MDTKKLEFIRLLDRALEIAAQTRSKNNAEQLNNLISTLQTIKSQTTADRLEPSQGILTLGLSRGIADWIDSLNSPLLEAVGTIEHHYQRYL